MIRSAEVYDIPMINKLGLLLNENFTKVFSLNEMLQDKFVKIFVYEKNDKIVGFISATDLGESCDILSIVVDPEYRNQKIATNLLNYLIGSLSDDLAIITLEVATKNTAAVELYKKFDFEIVNVRKKYYKDDDAYLMSRKSKLS